MSVTSIQSAPSTLTRIGPFPDPPLPPQRLGAVLRALRERIEQIAAHAGSTDAAAGADDLGKRTQLRPAVWQEPAVPPIAEELARDQRLLDAINNGRRASWAREQALSEQQPPRPPQPFRPKRPLVR